MPRKETRNAKKLKASELYSCRRRRVHRRRAHVSPRHDHARGDGPRRRDGDAARDEPHDLRPRGGRRLRDGLAAVHRRLSAHPGPARDGARRREADDARGGLVRLARRLLRADGRGRPGDARRARHLPHALARSTSPRRSAPTARSCRRPRPMGTPRPRRSSPTTRSERSRRRGSPRRACRSVRSSSSRPWSCCSSGRGSRGSTRGSRGWSSPPSSSDALGSWPVASPSSPVALGSSPVALGSSSVVPPRLSVVLACPSVALACPSVAPPSWRSSRSPSATVARIGRNALPTPAILDNRAGTAFAIPRAWPRLAEGIPLEASPSSR